MMKITVLSFLIVCLSCVNIRTPLTSSEKDAFKKKISSSKIEITFDRAQAMGLNAINGIEKLLPMGSSSGNIILLGNSNFFRIKNDSIHLDLPYFGQRQMAGGYNSSEGIKYNDKAIQTRKRFIDKKSAYILEYSLKSKSENYDIILTLFASHKSHLNVISSHRTNISYQGNWKIIK